MTEKFLSYVNQMLQDDKQNKEQKYREYNTAFWHMRSLIQIQTP